MLNLLSDKPLHDMTFLVMPSDSDPDANEWTIITTPIGASAVWMRCPRGHLISLSGRKIKQDGRVVGKVLCQKCSFKKSVKLHQWCEQDD